MIRLDNSVAFGNDAITVLQKWLASYQYYALETSLFYKSWILGHLYAHKICVTLTFWGKTVEIIVAFLIYRTRHLLRMWGRSGGPWCYMVTMTTREFTKIFSSSCTEWYYYDNNYSKWIINTHLWVMGRLVATLWLWSTKHDLRHLPKVTSVYCLLSLTLSREEGSTKESLLSRRLIVLAPPNYLNHNMSGSIERHSVQYFEKRP